KALHPLVDGRAAGAQQPGDLGNRSSEGGFQDGQGAPKDAGIRGSAQLLLKLALLGWRKEQIGHGKPRFPAKDTALPLGVNIQLATRLVSAIGALGLAGLPVPPALASPADLDRHFADADGSLV